MDVLALVVMVPSKMMRGRAFGVLGAAFTRCLGCEI